LPFGHPDAKKGNSYTIELKTAAERKMPEIL
jgi:hypothetical protein